MMLINDEYMNMALDILDKKGVADCHCDTLQLTLKPGYDILKVNDTCHLDLPRLKKGMTDIQFFAVCTDNIPGDPFRNSLAMIENFNYHVDKNHIFPILTGECVDKKQFINKSERGDVRECVDVTEQNEQTNALLAVLALEGAGMLPGEEEFLNLFYRLGVRCISLTWNYRNHLATGVMDRDTDGDRARGITAEGKKLLNKMEDKGIILDLAHISEKCFYEALGLYCKPPLVSHANAAALCPHPRNLKDEQILALARSGGIMCMSYYPPFIGADSDTFAALLNHFVYVSDLVGPEHVGIGSDFDGIDRTPAGLKDCSCHPLLIAGLLQKGFGARDAELISGGNIRRLLGHIL